MATVTYLVVLAALLLVLTIVYRADERERRYRRKVRPYPPRAVVHTGETAPAVRVRQAWNSRPWR